MLIISLRPASTLVVDPVLRDFQHDGPLTDQHGLPGPQSQHPTELVPEGVPNKAGFGKIKVFINIKFRWLDFFHRIGQISGLTCR